MIPETARADETGTFWEFVAGTPHYPGPERNGYADVLGCELKAGDILQTVAFSGLDIGWGFYLIVAADVEVIHPWVTEGDDGG